MCEGKKQGVSPSVASKDQIILVFLLKLKLGL